MASNETVADIVRELRDWNKHSFLDDYDHEWCILTADRIEAAHDREIAAKDAEIAELEAKLSNTETARKFFARRLDGAKKQVSELRECLKEAVREQ